MKRYLAEAIGTGWLVLGGCGAAVFAATVDYGIEYVGVSLAFGLTVLTMAYAIGHISGCHLNPAVTLGLVAGGRFDAKDAPGYIIAQCVGGIIAAGIIAFVFKNHVGFESLGGFATNGFGEHSPEGYSMAAVIVAEIVLTAFFLFVIMGSTDSRAPAGLAPIAIGLCLTLIHLISIPISNTSVNPARSTAMAVYVMGPAVAQLWVFWVAPIIGGVAGALMYRSVACKD